MQNPKKHLQSGQVGVITLLIMAVVLTIAIGLSRRTTQQQDASFIQDESTRVFNAAESGVEEALYDIYQAELLDSSPGTGDEFDLGQDQVSYAIQNQSTFEMFIGRGNTVEIPLDTNPSGNVAINWWNETADCDSSNRPPAVIVSVFQASTARHFGYDPCTRNPPTGFNLDSIGSGSGDYAYQVSISLVAADLLIRVKPIFNSTTFLITSGAISLAQYDVESTGFNPQEEIARTIEIRRSLPSAYGFMDYTLISGDTLTK